MSSNSSSVWLMAVPLAKNVAVIKANGNLSNTTNIDDRKLFLTVIFRKNRGFDAIDVI